jgi:hypothetical protein
MEKLKREIYRHTKITIFVDSKKIPAFQNTTTYTHNISEQGSLLEVSPPINHPSPPKAGDKIPINFLLSSSTGTISTLADIIWFHSPVLDKDGNQISAISVKFPSLDDQARNAIRQFLANPDKAGEKSPTPQTNERTCRSCKHYSKAHTSSRYADCTFHQMTIRDTDDDMSMTFSQIYSNPCKEYSPK